MALGAVLGLGLLNKISVLWLGFGIALGLVATPARRLLASPGPWLACAIALALFAPHLVWQQLHGWPTLEFVRNASQQMMLAKSPLSFAAEQLLVLGPVCAVLWLSGLAWYFTAEGGRRQRHLAFIWIGTIAEYQTAHLPHARSIPLAGTQTAPEGTAGQPPGGRLLPRTVLPHGQGGGGAAQQEGLQGDALELGVAEWRASGLPLAGKS